MVSNPPTQKIVPLAAATQNAVLLVVSAAENVAKRIESHMRNAGHPVRAAWVTDLEDIEDVLQRGTPDLVLCAKDLASAPLKDVVQLCGRLSPGLPVLLLSNKFSRDDATSALALGARDLVSHEDLHHLRHLELVLLRELTNHHHLRELNNTRARLADFESRHKQLVDGTNDAVAHIQEGILSHVNPAFAQMLDYENPAALLNQPLMDLVCPDHQPKVKEHLKQLNKGKVDGKPMECCLLKAGGGRVNIAAQLTRGSVDGENFIEMLIRADAAMSAVPPAPARPAAGRMAFVEALQAVTQSPQKLVCAALFMGVDDFGNFENRLGFQDAEEVMLKLMDWAKERLMPQDRLFRFSTGDLAALVARNNVNEINSAAEFLCKEIGKHIFATQGHEAQLTLTITAYPLAGGENPAEVINEIMREARKLSAKGGKQFLMLGPTAKSSAAEREDARKAAQVKRAIEENRLKLAYQSIASLEGETRQHFDVLVRMIDETGNEQHAGEFISAAEKFGLMRALDRWVTLRVLKLLTKRESVKESASLFVKISEDTLKDADSFAAWLAEALKQRPLKPQELVFEFQEVGLQNHIGKAKSLTKTLCDMGASIAIDHFGLSTNSAQLVDHIPANYIKFHRSYTQQFNDKEMQRKMSQLMEISRHKHIKTIVCHVEDANAMARLWQMGVSYIQGYHVQEPEVVLLSTDLLGR